MDYYRVDEVESVLNYYRTFSQVCFSRYLCHLHFLNSLKEVRTLTHLINLNTANVNLLKTSNVLLKRICQKFFLYC